LKGYSIFRALRIAAPTGKKLERSEMFDGVKIYGFWMSSLRIRARNLLDSDKPVYLSRPVAQ
jgi:hypothetical protein